MTTTASGLSAEHRAQARHRVLAACELLLANKQAVHYSQGSQRWQGIDDHLIASHGHFPDYSDCSSSSTWILWNALWVPFRHHDIVNGTRWHSGYTGTIAQHGKLVRHDENIKIGDLILYGPAPTYEHVAVAIGGGRVFSHGSEGGPYVLPLDYRPDRGPTHRFI
jgi:hypothetical protein